MNINRDNYETFFLLYVDNELSAPERNALELFLQNNSDLQEELEMLQLSTIEPEPIIFKGKSSLFKTEKITADTEEKLLLFIDNELDVAQSIKLQLLLAADSALTAELNLLKQTKLFVETTIVFADKKSLYRKEKDNVISFGWWKLAAAAVVIGFGIWGGVKYASNNSKDAGTETATNNLNPGVIKNLPVQTPTVQQQLQTKITAPKNVAVATEVTQKTAKKKLKETIAPATKTTQKNTVLQEDKNIAVQLKIVIKPSNNLPEPYFEKGNNTVNPIATTSTKPQAIQNAINNTSPDKTNEISNNNNARTVTFIDTNNNDGHFTFSDDEPKKSKLTGLLRKAERVLKRNTKLPEGDDNIKVASLSFATH